MYVHLFYEMSDKYISIPPSVAPVNKNQLTVNLNEKKPDILNQLERVNTLLISAMAKSTKNYRLC
jgi:hypothetical protein